jgi:hypothetical protein
VNKITARILYNEIAGSNPEDGFYVWADPTEESILTLQKLLDKAPFKTRNSTEFHTTVLYHIGSIPTEVKVPKDRPCTGEITELAVWTEKDGEKIVVALVKSPQIMSLHYELIGEGFKHTFDDFVPHISVGKRVDLNAETRTWLDEVNEYIKDNPLPIEYDKQLKATSLK